MNLSLYDELNPIKISELDALAFNAVPICKSPFVAPKWSGSDIAYVSGLIVKNTDSFKLLVDPANIPIVAGVWLVWIVALTLGFNATHCLASITLSNDATLYGVSTAYKSIPTCPSLYTTCTLLSCKVDDPEIKLVLSIKMSATLDVISWDIAVSLTQNNFPSSNNAKYLFWVPQYKKVLRAVGVVAP